ncbi:hypothetical protein OOK29_09955 [Streptomyces phaeochromogenes]|uniref:hypothetical protein n=1 Tax=Streptomyces phaeochromogenes TaxID=1923 RepID=UPI00225A466A|nr:hypothetical protein [Streptomyces phaeochromogenes]MCX5598462.1 hypothetical protein [Streptomyces phaeochromogenes]
MPVMPEGYDKSPFHWTDKLLLEAIEEGAEIRTRDGVKVTWDPRNEDDTRPWATSAGKRYADWYCYPTCERHCPWVSHLTGIHGVIDIHSTVDELVGRVSDLTEAWRRDEKTAQDSAYKRAAAVSSVVQACNENQSEAARRLGLDQSTVNKLVRKARSA